MVIVRVNEAISAMLPETTLVPEREWPELLARTAEGDQTALAMLYDQTSPHVFGFALKILNNREAAEEVTMDVYTQVWRQAHTYDHTRGTPRTWLMMLARTRAIDRLRADAVGLSRMEALDAARVFASDDPTPEAHTEEQERRRHVQHALAMLTAEQRQVIALAYFYGLSQSDIARKLQLPLGTVKTRIRLGMIKLRDTLKPYEPNLAT